MIKTDRENFAIELLTTVNELLLENKDNTDLLFLDKSTEEIYEIYEESVDTLIDPIKIAIDDIKDEFENDDEEHPAALKCDEEFCDNLDKLYEDLENTNDLVNYTGMLEFISNKAKEFKNYINSKNLRYDFCNSKLASRYQIPYTLINPNSNKELYDFVNQICVK